MYKEDLQEVANHVIEEIEDAKWKGGRAKVKINRPCPLSALQTRYKID